MWRPFLDAVSDMRRAGWRAWVGDALGATALMALFFGGFLVLEVLR